MANENQFRLRTRFVATRGVQEYRATIESLVTPDGVVLELGCGWGSTTAAGQAQPLLELVTAQSEPRSTRSHVTPSDG